MGELNKIRVNGVWYDLRDEMAHEILKNSKSGAYVQAEAPETGVIGTLWYDTDEEGGGEGGGGINLDILLAHINNKGNPHAVTATQVGADVKGSANAVRALLTQHMNDTNNPHNLTAIKIGADAKGSAAQALTDAKAYTDSEKAKYLPLAGGVMTGTINARGVFNILDFGTSGYFRGETTSGNKFDIFGYSNPTTLYVGSSYPALSLRGKNTRPTYNGTDLALYSDIPVIPDFPGMSGYLPLAGGTMTGELRVNGKDVVGGSKIVLESGSGQITNSGTQTLFGFLDSGRIAVGHGSYTLVIRGSATRPAYNEKDLALYSDLSSYLPLSGGTMTGAIYSTGDMQLRPQTGVIRFGDSLTNGSLAVLAGTNTTWYLRPGADKVFDLGVSGTRWKNLYLSGVLSDGTNSIAVANIANKNNYLPLSGGTMTGNIVLQNSNPHLGLVDSSGVAAYFQTYDDGSGLKAGFGYGWNNSLKIDSLGNMTLVGNLTDGTNSISIANIANKNDIATTKYAAASSSSHSIFKINGFGDWGSGAWYQKGFSMLITSRAGETVWLTLAANDSNTAARAIRLMNTYSKILKIYYSVSESAIYVTAAAWCNNVSAHIISNLYGDYVPTVAKASALASDAVEISITEMGPSGSGSSVTTKLGSASVPINLLGSAARPQYNSADLALYSDIPVIPDIPDVSNYLPLSGGTMTGLLKIDLNGNTVTIGSQNNDFCHIYNSADIPFVFNRTVATTSGDLGLSGYPWRNLYLSGVLTDGTNSISVANIANKNNYLPLSGGTLSGALTVSDKITQGSPSSDSTLTEMNRFKNDLFVEGSGAAPNVPQVAGFYLGKSTSDENRHMDIVSGATYSYIDFNKAGSNEDYDVRLLVNVENGDTVFRWGFGEHLTSKIFNVLGTIQQNGSPVALKSDIPNLSGYLPLTGGTLAGSLIAPVYKSDNTDSAIKLSHGNEVNFGSNSNQLFIGYQNRVGSSGSVDTYKFGTHSGVDGSTSGTIECGTIKAKSGIFSGALKVNGGGGYIAGRVYGGGDDEGLIIGRASNGYAGLILGTHNDVRSVFYLRDDNAALWRYVNGGTYELLHPGKSGTIATTADLPSTETWTFTLEDGSTVTKAVCVG